MFSRPYSLFIWRYSIQPPGAWHAVYTPTKGMTTGGHLLMYKALHLTEMSRAYDNSEDEEGVVRGNYATNKTYVVDRQTFI